MQQHRIISLLSILVMVIIPVIGWFLFAQPQLAAASSADQARLAAEAQVAASQAQVDKLEAASATLPKLRDELDELRGSIPSGVDPSGWIDGLSALAKVSKVEITAFTVSDPVAYVPATPPADPNAAAPDATPAPGDTAAPVATPAPVDFPGIVTNPLIDSSNLVAIPVTVEVTGTMSTILRFVNGLQTDNRLYLVSSLTTEPAADAQSKELFGKIGGFIWAIPTGEAGSPHPVSTIVKSMDPPKPPEPETPNPNGTATPNPNATSTPPPTNP